MCDTKVAFKVYPLRRHRRADVDNAPTHAPESSRVGIFSDVIWDCALLIDGLIGTARYLSGEEALRARAGFESTPTYLLHDAT